MKNILFLVMLLTATVTSAQVDTSALSISGFVETYYTFDMNQPDNHTRPAFLYNYNRHNEVNLNLGYVKAAYAENAVRANLALMAGTYANANLAAEPGVLQNIYEANAGIRVSRTKNLWLDAGIFSSHIGFESAHSPSCWTLTRSILAENSPYYESGVKLSYTSDNQKLFVSGLILNGWQRIQRIDGNNTPAGGYQLTIKPSDKITFNSSLFVGNNFPDNVSRIRVFHNFYAILLLHKNIGVIAGFDYGAQQIARSSSDYHTWYSPIFILKLTPVEKLSLVGRAEYYNDKDGVIIMTGTPNGFQTYSYSVNIDYAIAPKALWRLEGRVFESKDQIFTLDDEPDRQNYFVTSSIAISF